MFEINDIRKRSKNILNFWKKPHNWIPEQCREEVLLPNIQWYLQLTECLEIWSNKEGEATTEELCLAYAILGELIEGWLRLYYCIYFAHYMALEDSGKNKIKKQEEMTFEELEDFARGKVWQKGDGYDFFVTQIKSKRKCVSEDNKDRIGVLDDFLFDLDLYEEFIENIDIRLPYPDKH